MTAPLRYNLRAERGHGVHKGKVNLDSIKSAPSDSAFDAGRDTRIHDLFPDSLSSYIGNVYVIKTGEDPRLERSVYAKIKILNIIVQNAAENKIDMVFLWALQYDGTKRLPTANLDTFDLDSVPVGMRRDREMSAAYRGMGKRNSGIKRVLIGSRIGISKDGMLFDVAGRAIRGGERRGSILRRLRWAGVE